MDWANGPYSAKAIAKSTTKAGAPPYPGEKHPVVAAAYFLKAAQLNVGSPAPGKWLLLLTVLGTVVALLRFSQFKAWLLLWLPLLFYTLSIAYGSVPIFIPVWWPFSYYNVRYGLELLPAFAVFPVLLGFELMQLAGNRKREVAIWAVLCLCFAGSYFAAWAQVPITLREARVNARTRVAMEDAIAKFLAGVPGNATLLMYQGVHVGALQRAGIPLRHVISEVNHPDWEWALLDPAHRADYVIAFQGDPVWMSVREHPDQLIEMQSISVPDQARCTIYVPRR
jgi:hypothetical protein